VTRKKVLVAGVSGLVGSAAARRFAADPDFDVVGVARRRPEGLEGVELVAVDLLDRDACAEALTGHADVTHVVYAALYEMPGLLTGWRDRHQMDTNLAMLRNLFDPLVQAAPGLEHVSLLQGTKAYGAHVEPMRVPGREREPRHLHENFYWLQEDDVRGRQADGSWGLTVWRPVFIFGESLGSHMNAVPALGVYAALQRAAGLPLDWPGGVAPLVEAVDADLLADALHWGATAPQARDETFNVTNGDVFTLRNVWPALADAFGMEVGADVPRSLGAELPGRSAEWAALVDRFGLRAPKDLGAFVGQSFIYADVLSGFGLTAPSPPALLSTIKLRQAGFSACLDTEDMFRDLVERHQAKGLLPPRSW
jgi:nucleoside-diphosphate-sugar epimerase